ncbi:GNAT family N-acetyltransferase [Desulforamulus hydrothermalis]|uniref:N-acetyltransferase domain-containing protein n=1 Tax=Desulforamulus hydrothermalis Lam5 = DSM 18033 TaxID=1121428 RepID=K8DZY6_9FIRM|nr:GNAT family N-acetyltransferase [Desulforamulus hydrothermalis]CCO08742.1 hypothetical protein DESHY_50050 [Desulforamulus hydrothermalis Lam5 = DSM 18033]SHG70433.1 hypothetical protein SAMN02745177_00050 [Desulforamulus hydrothermalis Lam5 = DSM 18033]
MRDIKVYAGENCIVIHVKTNYLFPACATISRLHDNVWYFNRLIVPKCTRRQGLAGELMKKLVTLLDDNKIILINEVQGTGDLNNDQLVIFYKKYGFFETDRPYRLIRLPSR